MKKIPLLIVMAALPAMAAAQIPNEPVIDAAEDTTHVTTIADIIDVHSKLTSDHSTSSHFSDVWGRSSFFNIGLITHSSLKPKEEIELGYPEINDNKVPDFKSDFGVSLQVGHSYSLHKKPIANLLKFNLDFTYLDLSLTHYKKEEGEHVYNSDNTWDQPDEDYPGRTEEMQYLPWCLEKYDINYCMTLGPSITVAPFTYVNVPQLHYVKLNIYYHIGYQIGLMWMPSDKKADAAPHQYYDDDDSTKLNWQHGLVQNFGFSLDWKMIGLGFETRWSDRTYKTLDSSTYGNKNYKFKDNNSRIYLQLRF